MNYIRSYFKGYYKQGGIKELLVLALPMIVSTACDGVMTFTDRMFLARVGPEHMNAAMAGGIAFMMLTFFFIGLINYSTAIVAQYFGAGEKHNSSKATFQALLIALAAWPMVIFLKPLVIWFFEFTNTPESQIGHQINYINVLIWGALFSLLRSVFSCYFTGIGKTKIVMTATIAAMFVNVVLDYILIFGKFGMPEMGIKGAALATISGSFFATFILAVSYFRRDNVSEFSLSKSFRFRWEIMRKLLYFGYPAGLEMFLNFLAFSTMISIFHSKGDVSATATTIMFNWDLVSFIPLLGIEIAVTSLVGKYMGARKPHVAHRAALSAIKTGMFYSVVVLILFIFIPEALVRVFRPENPDAVFEQAVPLAVSMIRIATLYVLAEAVMVALIGALRGAGDTHFTMLCRLFRTGFLYL
jgi:MATE family multidrug resistance protein